MPTQNLSRNIDGLQITISQLTGWKSLRTMRKIAEAIGPSLAEVLRGMPQTKGIKLLDLDVSELTRGIAPALERFFDKMPEEDFVQLTKTLLETSVVIHNGQAMQLTAAFDTVFIGKPGTMLKVIWFALDANFGDFWSGLAGLAGQFQAAQNSEASPKTSAPVGSAGA